MEKTIDGKIMAWAEDELEHVYESKHPRLKSFGLSVIIGLIIGSGTILEYHTSIAGCFRSGNNLKQL